MGENKDGFFTVKRAYQVLERMPTPPLWKCWERIWKIRVQQRTKMFVWLLGHNKLLTNFGRWRRWMVEDPRRSGICEEVKETNRRMI